MSAAPGAPGAPASAGAPPETRALEPPATRVGRLVSGAYVEQRWEELKRAPATARPLQVLDATWFLKPVHGDRDARAEFAARRVPGALFFDIDELSEPHTTLPHMNPEPAYLARKLGEMGVDPAAELVVYDAVGQFSAARAWWMLVGIGCDALLLDGGLPKWISEGRPVASGPPPVLTPRPPPGFTPRPARDWVVSLAEMERLSKDASSVIFDARPAARFSGAAPEPRPGLRKGRIPNSYNVPFAQLLNKDGTFRGPAELLAAFERSGVDASRVVNRRVVTTCGSGTTACILSFALANFLGASAPVYDGAFAEWAQVAHPEREVVDDSADAAKKP